MLFRLSRMLEGGLVASGFHVHNVLLHAVASILLYAVAEKLFARVWSLAGGASTRAALAALIFAVHPVPPRPPLKKNGGPLSVRLIADEALPW
jgi:hypothetical protein